MRRREVLQVIACAIAITPDTIAAQTVAKTYRIGTLTVGPPIPPTEGTRKMLVEGLAKRGYKLGENLAYEARGAAGKIPQMPNLIQELKAANVDVVVTVGYPSAAAAKASGHSNGDRHWLRRSSGDGTGPKLCAPRRYCDRNC